MINPLDLMAGPFLAFYLAAGALTVMAAWLATSRLDRGPGSPLALQDPYAIAFLRAGPGEAIGVAVASLLDRNLIGPVEPKVAQLGEGTPLRATSAGRRRRTQPPLERAIVNRLERPATLRDLMADPGLMAACSDLAGDLGRRGFLADDTVRRQRLTMTLLIALPFLAIGLGRIALSLSRGHTNLLFLIAVMVIAAIVLGSIANRRLTSTGRQALANLRALFMPLYRRRDTLRAGTNADDVAFLAAVFGLAALPATASAIAAMLPPRHIDTGSADASDGSSGSGSSSCGGGSGCGGCGS